MLIKIKNLEKENSEYRRENLCNHPNKPITNEGQKGADNHIKNPSYFELAQSSSSASEYINELLEDSSCDATEKGGKYIFSLFLLN